MLKTILLPLLLVASLFATAPAHRLGNSLVAAFDGDVNKQHESGMDIHDVKHKMTTSLNDAIKIVSFDSALDIAAIRQKIDDVLDKARNELRKGFGKLESEVVKRVQSIIKIACPVSQDSGCWAADKVQCELHDVVEFVQEKRCELVNHALEALDKVKASFAQYEEANYNPKDSTHTITQQDYLDLGFVNGVLGDYLMDGTASKNDAGPIYFSESSIEQCMGDNEAIKGHTFSVARGRARRTAQRAWTGANADAKCIRTKEDGSKAINLGKHSVNNNEDPTKMTAEDECHNTQNGIAGLIKYYGGARQPRCDSTLMAVVGGDGRGRIGFLVDHVFFCTLHMTKMFQQRDVCSFKNIIQFRRGRRGTSRRSRNCITHSNHKKCNAL